MDETTLQPRSDCSQPPWSRLGAAAQQKQITRELDALVVEKLLWSAAYLTEGGHCPELHRCIEESWALAAERRRHLEESATS